MKQIIGDIFFMGNILRGGASCFSHLIANNFEEGFSHTAYVSNACKMKWRTNSNHCHECISKQYFCSLLEIHQIGVTEILLLLKGTKL